MVLTCESAPEPLAGLVKAQAAGLCLQELLAQSVQDGAWVFSTWMSSQVMLKLLVLRLHPTPTLNIGPRPHICKTIIFSHNNKYVMFAPSFQKDNNTARCCFSRLSCVQVYKSSYYDDLLRNCFHSNFSHLKQTAVWPLKKKTTVHIYSNPFLV